MDTSRPSKHCRAPAVFSLLARLLANTHAVSQVIPDEEDSAAAVVSLQQKRLAFAVFATASSINHSCRPNATLRFSLLSPSHPTKEAVLELVALESVPRGQELCISYGPVRGSHSLLERRASLSSQYLFLCRCEACLEDEGKEQLSQSIRSSASNAANGHVNNAADMALQQLLSELAQLNRAFSAALSSPSALLVLELSGLQPLSLSLLQLTHRHIPRPKQPYSQPSLPEREADTELFQTGRLLLLAADRSCAVRVSLIGVCCSLLDLTAQLCARTDRVARAARLVSLAIKLQESSGLHPPGDVALGRERVKLAQLWLHCGQLASAESCARKAYGDLEPFLLRSSLHSKNIVDDPDWVELNCMLKFFDSLKKERLG